MPGHEGTHKRAKGTRPRSIAIVGNAPEMGDQGARIDAADWVVRFNNAAGFGGRAGRRVTHLALVNHGGQMGQWLADPQFLHRPSVRGTERFVFPFPRKDEPSSQQAPEGRDWTGEAQALLRPIGTPVEILPPCVHRAAGAFLGEADKACPAPSTGFLLALHLVRAFGGTASIDVHGFGFEGWDGHDWRSERRWFEAMAAGGVIRVHPLDAQAAA